MTYLAYTIKMSNLEEEEQELIERLESIKRQKESLQNISIVNEWEEK